MQSQYERLTDGQWEIIKKFLNYQRKRSLELRKVVDAILFVSRTGIQWRNLKETNFPHWQAVYYYFSKWTKSGIWNKINAELIKMERIENQREEKPSIFIVDSQSIKLAPMIYEHRGVDGFKKINGRKRQIITDVTGRIYGSIVHAANIHDSVASISFLTIIQNYRKRLKKILADHAYQGEFSKIVEENQVDFEVPKREEGQKGFVVEAKRWVVERSFAWLNFFRRTTLDYEHTPESAQSFVLIANISMCLSKFK